MKDHSQYLKKEERTLSKKSLLFFFLYIVVFGFFLIASQNIYLYQEGPKKQAQSANQKRISLFNYFTKFLIP